MQLILFLLKHGADLLNPNKFKVSSLHHATLNNQPISIALLIRLGHDIEVKDAEGRTPLHLACIYNLDISVELLLTLGADFEAQDDYGRTPIFYAVDEATRTYTTQFVRTLLYAGASPNIMDKSGKKPINIL